MGKKILQLVLAAFALAGLVSWAWFHIAGGWGTNAFLHLWAAAAIASLPCAIGARALGNRMRDADDVCGQRLGTGTAAAYVLLLFAPLVEMLVGNL